MCSWLNIKISIIHLLILLCLSYSATAQDNPYKCTSNGNYTTNSTYSTNLNALLRSLSLNMTATGFYTSSMGQDPNTVNGFALCRADQTLDQCRACVGSATREVLITCPNERQAAIWYEYCTLRYTNDPIHQTQTKDPIRMLRNTQNATNGDQFKQDRTTLLNDLTAQAANGTSALKVGVGTRNSSDSTIYGLLQCTPDFSAEDCRNCLKEIAQVLEIYTSRGFRVLGPDCNIRYELIGFYNETRLRELRVPLLTSSPPANLEVSKGLGLGLLQFTRTDDKGCDQGLPLLRLTDWLFCEIYQKFTV